MDIAMCKNTTCPSNKYCYRFTATPNEFRQSYAGFTLEEDEVSCSHFYPNGKDSEKCKRGGVKRDGEICNKDECSYPKCVEDSYCPCCHQTNGVHKMGCETIKATIINIMEDDEKLGLYDDIIDVVNRQGDISEGDLPSIIDFEGPTEQTEADIEYVQWNHEKQLWEKLNK